MRFYEKGKDKAFWETVRTDPAYSFLVKELLEIYEKDGQGEIKDISYDAFMEYHRTGSRQKFELDYYFPRRRRLNACALLSLIYPEEEAYFQNLMNTIWAICNEYCWSLPNHTKDSDVIYNDWYIDLFAAETGYALSEIRFLLGDRMSVIMKERIRAELDKRIIRSFQEHTYGWESSEHNWASVCACSVGCTFLYERPELFAQVKGRIDRALEAFLRSFREDGVCREGLGYWQYGFGFYISYAQRLLERSEGRENLFADPHIREIAQFPVMTYLDGNTTVSFSDSSRTGCVGLGTMSILRSHYGDLIPAFPSQYYATNDRCGRWNLHIDSIVWYDPQMAVASEDTPAIYYKEISGWFVKRCAGYRFAAKGGDNGEPHNHNDLGSFILCRGGRQILTDLGHGVYTRQYFEQSGYELLCKRSGGHSVPLINGREQCNGGEYIAPISYDGEKLAIDLSLAYPGIQAEQFLREFTFTQHSVRMRDTFTAIYDAGEPARVTERLVSLIKPVLLDGRIALEEVALIYDPSWKVTVTEQVHTGPYRGEETVYLIDFTTDCETEEFLVEFVCPE